MNGWPGSHGKIKTVDEIIEVIRKERKELLSFVPEVLLGFLSFDEANAVLEGLGVDPMPSHDRDEWVVPPRTKEAILEQAETYMREYGWPKCIDGRGLSAQRTIQKMHAWIWLAGDEGDIEYATSWDNYTMYGAPILAEICKYYGWPIPDSDAVRKMVRGEPCGPCCSGCC
jgi:hypothetical protein